MARRRRGFVPAYRLHKSSGQARVIINGEHIYLGRIGSAESREKYARLIAESTAPTDHFGGGCATKGVFQDLALNELLLASSRFL